MTLPRVPVTSLWGLAIVVALPVLVWAGRKVFDRLLENYESTIPDV